MKRILVVGVVAITVLAVGAYGTIAQFGIVEDQKSHSEITNPGAPAPPAIGVSPSPCQECFFPLPAQTPPFEPCRSPDPTLPLPEYVQVSRVEMAGWQRYSSPNSGIAFQYPPDWIAETDSQPAAGDPRGRVIEIIALRSPEMKDGNLAAAGAAKIDIEIGPRLTGYSCVEGQAKQIPFSIDNLPTLLVLSAFPTGESSAPGFGLYAAARVSDNIGLMIAGITQDPEKLDFIKTIIESTTADSTVSE